MLDIPDPPTTENIELDQDIASNLDLSKSKSIFCFHNEICYLLLESKSTDPQTGSNIKKNYLFSLSPKGSKSSYKWESISPLPFGYREGQSVTSTSSSLVFFGGIEDAVLYNDLWMITNSKKWFCIGTDIPARYDHAACSDSHGNLVIYGGRGSAKAGCFNDLYLVKLAQQEVTEIQFPGIDLPYLTSHSLTLLDDGTFFLIGLDAKRNTPDIMMYKLDIENRTLTPIKPCYSNVISSKHYSSLIFGMIFLFGQNSKPILMLDQTENVWIPLTANAFEDKNVDLLSLGKALKKNSYVFVSKAFSDNKCIHVISDDLSQFSITTLPIFTDEPPEDIRQSPQYTHFIKQCLLAGFKYFETIKPNAPRLHYEMKNLAPQLEKVMPSEIVRGYFDSITQKTLAERLYKKANRITQLMESFKQEDNIENPESGSDLAALEEKVTKSTLSVHHTITQINDLNKSAKKDIAKLNAEAENLSRAIEKETFGYLTLCQQQPQKSTKTTMQMLEQKCRELANEIQFEQSRLNTERNNIDSKNFIKKSTIFNISDQLTLLIQDEYQKVAQLRKVKNDFFHTIAALMELRNRELSLMDPTIRRSAEIFFRTPQFITDVKESQEKLEVIKSNIKSYMADLDPKVKIKKEESFEAKLDNIKKSIVELSQWSIGASRLLQYNISNPAQRQQPYNPNTEYVTPYNICAGNQNLFFSDLENIFTKIEKTIDTLIVSPELL